jgi:hypothetical protein
VSGVAEARVEILLPAGVAVQTYYKFGPRPGDPRSQWYEFAWDGETGATIETGRILLDFRDGKRGDRDLAVNGSIVDPGGPAFVLDDPQPLKPVVECVEKADHGAWRARFGYSNRNDVPVDVRVGSDNSMAPDPEDQGQPDLFYPGRHKDVFRTTFEGRELVWTLEGPDGRRRHATATKDSPRCSSRPDLREAFAFGADGFTRAVPNAPAARYTKVRQDRDLRYAPVRGYGYTRTDGLDSSPNNRHVYSGPDEIYDQFIGIKEQSGGRIVFRVDLPDGYYRFVAAGGDARFDGHSTTLRVRDGSDGPLRTLVKDEQLPAGRFYRVGFDGLWPPEADDDGERPDFEARITSPVLRVKSGFLEVHQVVGKGSDTGGDLSLLEIWEVDGP